MKNPVYAGKMPFQDQCRSYNESIKRIFMNLGQINGLASNIRCEW